jgi:hypothetical protein
VAADDQTKTGAGHPAAIPLAKKSPMVRSSYAFRLLQAACIKDATLRKETLDALGDPAPRESNRSTEERDCAKR